MTTARSTRQGRVLFTGVVLGFVALSLSGCGSSAEETIPESIPLVRTPLPPASEKSARDIRPEWWHNDLKREGGKVSVCRLADDLDLLVARRKAMEAATEAYFAATGLAGKDAQIEADSLRLPDGKFRAFVRMTGAAR